MSPGVTFKRRPIVALVVLAVVGLGLSYNSVGKGAKIPPQEVAYT